MIKTEMVLADHLVSGDTKIKIAAHSIKNLLSEIDHKVEVIPEDDAFRLVTLLTSLKGKPLTKEEIEIAWEIGNYK